MLEKDEWHGSDSTFLDFFRTIRVDHRILLLADCLASDLFEF